MPRPLAESSVRDAVEQAWREVLDADELADDANFFACGGDSFAAMRLLARIEEATGVAMVFGDLLDAPVLGAFAERAVAAPRGRPPTASAEPPRTSGPLTPMQREQWRGRRVPSGAEIYWLYEIDGALDVDALRRAFAELAARQGILRTTIRRRWGRLRQVAARSTPDLLRVVDHAGDVPKRPRSPAAVAQQLVDEDYGPFDYRRGPLVRATLVVLGPRRHVLSVAASEMALDASSRGVFTRGVSTLYRLLHDTGSADAYPPPPLQYTDFAVALRKRTPRRRLLEQFAYWRTKLAELSPITIRGHSLSPAVDFSTSTVPEHSLELVPGFVAGVNGLARSRSVSTFNVLAAAFVVVLDAIGEGGTSAFTTTVVNRDVHGADQLVGPFFNILVVQVTFDSAGTAADLIDATASATREAFLNRDVPFARVARFHQGPPDDSVLDPTRIRFQMHEDPGEIDLVGVRLRPIPPPFKPTHHLYLTATKTAADGLMLYFSCRPDMPAQLTRNFVSTFRRVVDAMVRDPAIPVVELVGQARRALVRSS